MKRPRGHQRADPAQKTENEKMTANIARTLAGPALQYSGFAGPPHRGSGSLRPSHSGTSANGKLIVVPTMMEAAVVNPGPVRVFGFDVEYAGSGDPYEGSASQAFNRGRQLITPYYQLPQGQNLGLTSDVRHRQQQPQPVVLGWKQGPSFAAAVNHVFTWDHPANANVASVNGANADVQVSPFKQQTRALGGASAPGFISERSRR